MPDDLKAKPPTGELPANELTKVDPTVRARRHAMHRSDDGEAFLPDPTRRGAHVTGNDAEYFGESFVASATTGEPLHMDANDEVLEDEDGGPFLELDSEGNTVGGENEVVGVTASEEREYSLPRERNVSRSLPR